MTYSSDSLKNFSKNGLQDFGDLLDHWISNRLIYKLNCVTIKNQLEILVEQPRNSDILNFQKMDHKILVIG